MYSIEAVSAVAAQGQTAVFYLSREHCSADCGSNDGATRGAKRWQRNTIMHRNNRPRIDFLRRLKNTGWTREITTAKRD